MRVPIEMQQLGPDFDSGVIVEWLCQVGDSIQKGQPICRVETEKIDVDLASLDAGTLTEIVADPGTEVARGAVIGYLEVVS